jgi:type I restriction-modification system DNA methylase subunit
MSVVLIGTVDMSSSLFFVFIKNPECYAEQDIEKVALNYHNWQQADFKTTYQDIPEFCKSARFEEIEANNFSLIPVF